jgi:pilus assembly protein CpaC
MRKISLITAVVLGGIMILPLRNFALDDIGSEIRLYIGETKIISVNNPERVAIGNPAVADVGSVSKSEATIIPKGAGMTTLVIWDNFGENSYQVRVFPENMNEAKRRIDNLLKKLNLPEVTTKAEDEEQKVYLMGKVKTAQQKERMNTALGELKAKTMDLTSIREDETIIEIDVQVLELNRGATDTLGFSWPGHVSFSVTDASKGMVPGTPVPFFKLFDFNKFTRTALGSAGDDFSFRVDMLIQEGKARILSRPRMSCQSGKEAKLLVGGEVPVLSATMSSGGSAASSPSATPGNVEYKEYGIILNVKPSVDENRRIHLSLGLEVSEVGEEISTTYALAYTFTKRNASTELSVNDGETMAIGGLIKRRDQETLRKFPWLADLPMIGGFFRQRTTTQGGGVESSTDAELFLLLTPHIVSEPGKEVKEVKEAREEARPQAQPQQHRPEPPAYSETKTSLDPVSQYARVIQQRILENVIYPQEARAAGFQGMVRLNLKLSYRGELLDAAIKKSSGYKMLDDSALNAAKSSASYPPFPASLPQQELWIEVPVSYQLD